MPRIQLEMEAARQFRRHGGLPAPWAAADPQDVRQVHSRNVRRMSTHAIFRPPPAHNEPIHDYAPGSPERLRLQLRLEQMRSQPTQNPLRSAGPTSFHAPPHPAPLPPTQTPTPPT